MALIRDSKGRGADVAVSSHGALQSQRQFEFAPSADAWTPLPGFSGPCALEEDDFPFERISENFDEPGRNVYPDFRRVRHAEGYELKGLAYPGREADYDCNSRAPCGEHNGR